MSERLVGLNRKTSNLPEPAIQQTQPKGASLPHAARQFIEYLRVEKGLAANSVASYQCDLEDFFASAKKHNRKLGPVDREDIRQYLRSLYERGLSARSVARHLVTLRSFFRFLSKEGSISRDPTAEIEAPRVGMSLPKYLTAAEVESLLAQPDVSTPRGLRDRALIELLYATGMRVSELTGLRSADVNLDASYLTCTGKGRKQRIVPIGDEAAAWVRRYLRDARGALLGRRSSPRLFVNARGAGVGLTRVGFWKILKRYARQAGLKASRRCSAFSGATVPQQTVIPHWQVSKKSCGKNRCADRRGCTAIKFSANSAVMPRMCADRSLPARPRAGCAGPGPRT